MKEKSLVYSEGDVLGEGNSLTVSYALPSFKQNGISQGKKICSKVQTGKSHRTTLT